MPAPPAYFAWGCFRYFDSEREMRLAGRVYQYGLPGHGSQAEQPASLPSGMPEQTSTYSVEGASDAGEHLTDILPH